MASTQRTSPSARQPDGLATFLGWFSLGLGVPQLLAPGAVNRAIGVADDGEARMWQRVVGMRELAAAGGILVQRRPAEWARARVAGDVMDLALLVSALRGKDASRGRLLGALASVVGIAVVDAVEAARLSEESELPAPPFAVEPKPERTELKVRASITVLQSRAELYRFWHDFQNLPTFMAHLEAVEVTAEGRSHWRAKGPAGWTVEWDAEIVRDVPDELIAWRSLEGATVPNSGSVRFVTAPGDQGTEIHLEIDYTPPGGKLGASVAKLFGEEPKIQVKDDLRRLKQVVETGEVVRSEGTPEGALARRLILQRPAQPVGSAS
jgi:uncharacterized membrane protein